MISFSVSWNSSDEEMNQFNHYQFGNVQSTVASRTRSHTPPHEHHERKQVFLLRFSSRLFIWFSFRNHLPMENDRILI